MGLSIKTLATVMALAVLQSSGGDALPVHARQSPENNTVVYTNDNGLNFTHIDATLPNVTIFATGKCIRI